MKIPNKRELHQIAFNHLSLNILRIFIKNVLSFQIILTTVSNNFQSLEMKNYNMILPEKMQKYQLYHQVKLINMNILQVKK